MSRLLCSSKCLLFQPHALRVEAHRRRHTQGGAGSSSVPQQKQQQQQQQKTPKSKCPCSYSYSPTDQHYFNFGKTRKNVIMTSTPKTPHNTSRHRRCPDKPHNLVAHASGECTLVAAHASVALRSRQVSVSKTRRGNAPTPRLLTLCLLLTGGRSLRCSFLPGTEQVELLLRHVVRHPTRFMAASTHKSSGPFLQYVQRFQR